MVPLIKVKIINFQTLPIIVAIFQTKGTERAREHLFEIYNIQNCVVYLTTSTCYQKRGQIAITIPLRIVKFM